MDFFHAAICFSPVEGERENITLAAPVAVTGPRRQGTATHTHTHTHTHRVSVLIRQPVSQEGGRKCQRSDEIEKERRSVCGLADVLEPHKPSPPLKKKKPKRDRHGRPRSRRRRRLGCLLRPHAEPRQLHQVAVSTICTWIRSARSILCAERKREREARSAALCCDARVGGRGRGRDPRPQVARVHRERDDIWTFVRLA